MIKRVFPILLSLLLLLGLPINAFAHDVPQERNDCTIEVQVCYEGENVSGGTFTAVRIGYVGEEDGNYFFYRVLDDVLLDQLDAPEAASELELFYEANRDTHTFDTQTVPLENGIALFENLQTGLYLIIQETPAQGFTKLRTFLVTVPYLQEGVYQYNVTAAAKCEVEREPEPTEPPPTGPTDPDLPQTGQLNWPVPLMAVSGMALIALGCILRFRKKENYEQEAG